MGRSLSQILPFTKLSRMVSGQTPRGRSSSAGKFTIFVVVSTSTVGTGVSLTMWKQRMLKRWGNWHVALMSKAQFQRKICDLPETAKVSRQCCRGNWCVRIWQKKTLIERYPSKWKYYHIWDLERCIDLYGADDADVQYVYNISPCKLVN